MWKHKVHPHIAVLSLGSVLALSAIFIYYSHAQVLAQTEMENQALASQPIIKPKHYYLTDVVVDAQAAYVYDINTKKVLYEKNADLALPLASITKVMTSFTAAEHHATGTIVTISEHALATDGESGLYAGEEWKLGDLISFTLISSSNDGAEAIADEFPPFVTSMNEEARKLGLTSLSFNNASGLDINAGSTGGYGSAKDIAKLFEYTLKTHPDLIEQTSFASKRFNSNTTAHIAKNTNTIIGSIPNLIASKTGYTLDAGGNLAIVFDRGLNEPVVAVVLGSTYDGRFSDILRLASSTLRTYNQ